MNLLEQVFIRDGIMIARIGDTFVAGLTKMNATTKYLVECAFAEQSVPHRISIAAQSLLGPETLIGEFRLQHRRSQFHIEIEEVPRPVCFMEQTTSFVL